MRLGCVAREGKRVLDGMVHFFGLRCQLCLQVVTHPRESLLCGHCAKRLAQRRGGFCPRCGTCYADPVAPIHVCAACRLNPPPWSRLGFYAPYEGILREIVHRHKFGHDHGVGRVLRHLLAEICSLHGLNAYDAAVPVPLRRSRLFWRGFNQSAELARMATRHFGCLYLPEGLRKIRETVPQASLGRKDRLLNVRGAFVGSSACGGRRILLVDDVMTTGATLNACATACLAAGAVRVDVLILARALIS